MGCERKGEDPSDLSKFVYSKRARRRGEEGERENDEEKRITKA